VTYTDPQAAAVGADAARFSGTARLVEVARTATYTREYARSNGFLTLLSDGERLTGAQAFGPEAGSGSSRRRSPSGRRAPRRAA
jgi:dihydrolipoamide dehydrogenase